MVKKETALEVINRDKCTCQFCGKRGVFVIRYGRPTVVEPLNGLELTPGQVYNGKDCIKFELHRQKPMAAGGDDSPENLELACRKCNRERGYLTYFLGKNGYFTKSVQT